MTGKEFLRERKSLGWTQGKVAKVMGCAVRSVRRWETGEVRVPQALKTIIALRKAKQELCQAVDELLNDLAANHPAALDTTHAGRVFRVLLEEDRNGI
jgi:transcriptional regulator with XRE-family HTH domain